MPGICAEVQQQINLPVTSKGKEDNRLWVKCFKTLPSPSGYGFGLLWAVDLAWKDIKHIFFFFLIYSAI